MPFSSFNGSFAGGQRASTDTFGFGRLSKSGLIVHYDAANSTSYGGSGTTFTDLTSYANHGTIVGGPTFDTNKFTWTSGDYIITPNIADHITGANTNHAVEIWVRPTGDGVVVTYAGQSDPLAGYHHSAIEIVSGQVEFGLWNGTGITSSGPTGSIAMNQWHQIVLSYTGNVVRGFVNGQRVCKFNVTWDDPQGSTGAFHVVAGVSDVTNQGDGTTFDGDLRILRVYGRPLKRPDVRRNLAKNKRALDNTETVQTYTTTGQDTWTAPLGVTSVEYLVVGGGGGGGNGYDTGGGGGGSAGVVLTGNLNVRPNRKYGITVGSGGSGGADTRANNNGSDGDDSIFSSVTASGGDAGNGSRTVQRSHSDGGDAQAGSTVGQGGDGGGNASSPGGGSGGGGGGAGGAGSNGSSGVGGAGGAGTSSSISGSAVTYGAGGAGARGNFNTTEGANGSANTGNGGGGGGAASFNSGGGGNGGSGIVILKWGGSAALWDPANDITPAYWLDASDTSSYTLSSSTLNTVTDKAGNFTVTIDGTPTRISSSLNSLNVWDFDGSESLITGSGPYTSSGNHWAIGVFQYHATDSTKDSFFSADGTRTYAVSSSQSNNTWTGEIDYDGSNSIVTGTAKNDFTTSISINTWVIVSIVFNKTGNQIFGRINGTTATSTDAYNLAMDTNATDVRMMRNRAGVKLDGRMAEYFHVAGVPGTGGTDISDVEKAEGYIAHKWGLEGNLPISHPYKSSAPTA